MTAILGYIADDNNESNIRTFFASDGRVIWYTASGDMIQDDYKKIKRFGNFLISFNGEVSFFEEFIRILNSIDSETSSIQSLQNAINCKYDYDQYLSRMHGQSKSYHSNIIVYDLSNRILTHHYAGNVSFDRCLNISFNFKILANNKIYHFGSFTSFINKAMGSEDAYCVERDDLLGSTIDEQRNLIIAKFRSLDASVSGVGDLHSFYIANGEYDVVFSEID